MLQKFLKYIRYEKNYSSHTVLSYNNDLSAFENYLLRETGCVDHTLVDGDIVRNYVMSLMDEKMSHNSVGRKLSALRTFYRFLVKTGVIANSPTEMVVKPKGAKPLPCFVRQAEMDCLLDDVMRIDDGSFDAVRDRAVMMMLYHTGMRRAELISLTDKDIDFASNTVKVTGKRNKQRIIPFGDELAKEIKEYITLRNREVENKSSALFVKKDGEPLYPMMVYRLVKANLERVSTLSKLSPHVVRHTFASAMLNDGAEINSVKELLGHASLSSTQVYTHITFEELKYSYNHAHPRALKKGGLYGD